MLPNKNFCFWFLIASVFALAAAQEDRVCPRRLWFLRGNICYEAFEERLNRSIAEQRCESLGARLAPIRNDNADTLNLLWSNSHLSSGLWYWISSPRCRQMSVQLMAGLQYNTTQRSAACNLRADGFICQMESVSAVLHCDSNRWVPYPHDGNCYIVYNTAGTRAQAARKCRRRDSELAVIQNGNDIIRQLGLNDNNRLVNNRYYWTGNGNGLSCRQMMFNGVVIRRQRQDCDSLAEGFICARPGRRD